MNTLLKCGADDRHLDTANRYVRPFVVGTQCDRSVLGTLNRMKGDVEHLLWYDNVNIADTTGYRLGAWLADMPWTAKGRGYLHPQKDMLGLLDGLSGAALPRHKQTDTKVGTAEELPDNVVSMQAFRDRS